jgi:phospholipid/cholesterol/gamma-HCH transport system substrate-binding protein
MRARTVAVTALGIALVAVVYFAFFGGGAYTIHARFENASLLVEGGEVQVAGRKVGSVQKVSLSDEGQADVELEITDDEVTPLHVGTRASVRAVGQAGVANRFVDLAPGSARNGELDDGAILSTDQTVSAVNLDALLNTFTPQTRKDLQEVIARSDDIFAGSGAGAYNRMLVKLDPALGQVARLAADINGDGRQLRKLIDTAESTASALASRRPELQSAVESSAGWLTQLANERDAVSSSLERAPGVLDQARTTLDLAGESVTELRPALEDIPVAAKPLRGFLVKVERTLPKATPVATELNRQLPALTTALNRFPALEKSLVPALRSTEKAVKGLRPILGPLRLYAPDLILGVVNGLAGVAVGNYTSIGHYTRLEFVQPPQTILSGMLASTLTGGPLVPGLFDQKSHLTERCPGGALPPAPDGSNANIGRGVEWAPGKPLCDLSQSMSPDVNEP